MFVEDVAVGDALRRLLEGVETNIKVRDEVDEQQLPGRQSTGMLDDYRTDQQKAGNDNLDELRSGRCMMMVVVMPAATIVLMLVFMMMPAAAVVLMLVVMMPASTIVFMLVVMMPAATVVLMLVVMEFAATTVLMMMITVMLEMGCIFHILNTFCSFDLNCFLLQRYIRFLATELQCLMKPESLVPFQV